jgi:cytochrome d ubiquinol oxidase subunit I
MEFQFGTNWSRFAAAAGGVIGQTLAMEGVFAFFLESSFLGLLLHGEKRLGPRGHWAAAVMVWLGSWASGFFIVATNAWMQHPVGYRLSAAGDIELESLWAMLTNPWAFWQYWHTMLGAVVTGSFAMEACGAYYLLTDKHREFGQTFLRIAVPAGLAASVLVAFPTGDSQGKMVARHQPVTLAAMEALFDTHHGAPLAIVGQPDMERQELDNPILVPRALSFLTYNRWKAQVRGLNEFPREDWPQNIPLLYYAFHIMVGLGSVFVLIWLLAAAQLRGGRLFRRRWMQWVLLLAFPFPYIANTAGWLTAELGRQPWLIYGLLRTADGTSVGISTGNALFTLLGFMGLYTVLSILFVFLITRELDRGPQAAAQHDRPGVPRGAAA